MSNSLDPDQDRHSVGPDLGPNGLQRLSADEKNLQLAWKVLKSCFDTVDLDDRLQNVASLRGLHCFVIIKSTRIQI